MTMLARLRAEIETAELGRCVLVLLPLMLTALISGEAVWWRAAIVTISGFIAMERSGLAPVGVALHGLAIAAGFLALLTALAVPPLFILGAAALAAVSILVTAAGAKLRFLGIFTFVPALYLACETAEGVPAADLLQRGVAFLPLIAVALAPVLLLSIATHHRGRDAMVTYARHMRRLLRWTELGARARTGEAIVAVTLAVATASWVVEWQHLPRGQWVIWSAAAVVTGDAATGRRKMRDRAVGAMLGVPAGILAGLLIPHSAVAYGLTEIAALLTLVTFRRYVLGYGVRCAGVALALMLAGQSTAVAAERAGNVILGGLIGILFVTGIRAVMVARDKSTLAKGAARGVGGGVR